MFEAKTLCKISLKTSLYLFQFSNHEGLHSKVNMGLFQHCLNVLYTTLLHLPPL
jgi:hypothetical protein